MSFIDKLLVKPGKKLKLSNFDPESTPGLKSKLASKRVLAANLPRMSDLQYVLYAENKRALLIVLQALDTGGKDGTIRHVTSSLNPQGCKVTSFKVPSAEELDHDFLWRIHNAVPAKGDIGIFNRSHYEDVLVVRVHNLVPKSVWSQRYEQINEFERNLAGNNVTILKFYLHISKDEQKRRFQARLKDPRKHWKLAPNDFKEREHWNDYIGAYEDALENCSTDWAPWYVIPANQKWYRNAAISQVLLETLESMKLKLPGPSFDVSKYKLVD